MIFRSFKRHLMSGCLSFYDVSSLGWWVPALLTYGSWRVVIVYYSFFKEELFISYGLTSGTYRQCRKSKVNTSCFPFVSFQYNELVHLPLPMMTSYFCLILFWNHGFKQMWYVSTHCSYFFLMMPKLSHFWASRNLFSLAPNLFLSRP